MSTTLPERMQKGEASSNGSGKSRMGNLLHPAKRRKAYVALAAVGLVVALVLIGSAVMEGVTSSQRPLVLYPVARSELPITVTERGNLESQQKTEIVCEVENIGYERGGGSNGTQILFIVPNGKSVKEGDMLVELDSAPLRERLDNQEIQTEQARAEQIQAKAKHENQIDQNETTLREAQLQVELAKLELKMYEDGEDGTFQIALQELDLKIEEAKNQIVEAQAAMAMQTTDRTGIEQLYKLGYRGKGDLDQAVYKYLQAEDSLVRATNTLANAMSNRRKLQEYEYPMQKLTLEGKLNTAERALVQVKRDNDSLLAQALAARNAANETLEKEAEKLEKYQAQLVKCKIYAPHDGMVVYADESNRRWANTVIGEGAFVRERQKILTLPDLSRMQVKTAVHESVLDQVEQDMDVTVQIDAFPDRTYKGSVKSVAVLPDQGGWLSSDIKVYETIVTIDEEVEQLKPGMTAVAEIHVDHLKDVLKVPVQAIVQVGDENWCYVDRGGNVERRPVSLGRTNDKFVEISDGLTEGESVVLNPMDVMDHSEDTPSKPSPTADGVAQL
jgi:HlyD family secretion protein